LTDTPFLGFAGEEWAGTLETKVIRSASRQGDTVRAALRSVIDQELDDIRWRALGNLAGSDPQDSLLRFIRDVRFLLAEVDCLRAASYRQSQVIEHLEEEHASLELSARALKSFGEEQIDRLTECRQRVAVLLEALTVAADGLNNAVARSSDDHDRENYRRAVERVRSAVSGDHFTEPPGFGSDVAADPD
jgi:hypothetical protein